VCVCVYVRARVCIGGIILARGVWGDPLCVRAYVRVCVCAYVCACVCALSVCVCVRARARVYRRDYFSKWCVGRSAEYQPD